MNKFFAGLIAAALSITAAYGQSAGTVTNHAFAIGKGPNVQGYTSLLCGTAQLAVGQAAADPICRTLSGDATLSAAGALTLGTVNANVGTFGSATQTVTFTVDAKGRITAASQQNIAIPFTQLTGSLACGQTPAYTGDTTKPAGSCATTTVKLNGVAFGTSPATDTIPVITAALTATYTAMPNCPTGVLQYTTATHLFNCGAGGSGTVTNQTNTASGGLVTSGNCANTTTNAGSPCNYALTAARQTNPTIQRFTSGSGTYTTPANVLWIEIEMVGAGGGAGAATTNNGTVGGASCWNTSGAACTAPVLSAGGGNLGNTSAGGSVGGTATGGNIYNIAGGDSFAYNLLGASQAVGGNGGNSCRGGGARGGVGAGSAASNNTGGGGGGGGQASTTGGAGGAGGACVKHIINAPAATYTYAVGVGGTGGAAGVAAGGNGGSGEIDVIEHYN